MSNGITGYSNDTLDKWLTKRDCAVQRSGCPHVLHNDADIRRDLTARYFNTCKQLNKLALAT